MYVPSIMCRWTLSALVSPGVLPTRDPTLLSSATETTKTCQYANIDSHAFHCPPLTSLDFCIFMYMCKMCKSAVPMFLILKNLFHCYCTSPSSLLLSLFFCLHLSLLFFLSCFTRWRSSCFFFPVMLSQLHCYWSHFPSSLLSHFICHLPSLLSFSPLSRFSLVATSPQPIPFTFCPLPSLLFWMFSFFL